MPSISQRLGLVKPSRTDPFVTSDISNNWQKLDDAPGVHICTSTTRPSWGAAQAGRLIVENNTNLTWRWTGTTFVRTGPSGILRKTNGDIAYNMRDYDLSYTSSTWTRIMGITDVIVPAGNRPLQINVAAPRVLADAGMAEFAVIRSMDSNGTPLIDRWQVIGSSTGSMGDKGGCTARVSIDVDVAPGIYNYTLQFRTWQNNTRATISAGARPLKFWISEL